MIHGSPINKPVATTALVAAYYIEEKKNKEIETVFSRKYAFIFFKLEYFFNYSLKERITMIRPIKFQKFLLKCSEITKWVKLISHDLSIVVYSVCN